MKIVVIGTRGIPATFGGIERHCEELYSRLVEMGHKVTIYSRKGYVDETLKQYKGIKLVPLWAPKSKHLEASLHTLWALIHAMLSDAQIIHFHAQGPCLFAWLPKILTPDKKLVFTCHGLDWQRNKWNKLAQRFIKMGELSSAKNFDLQITVSDALFQYYKNKYNINPITIANGTSSSEYVEPNYIKKNFGLDKKNYLLFVGRLVPEKAPDQLIKAYKNIQTDKKLVITGDSSSTDEYTQYLKELAKGDNRIIFTSYLYGKELNEIYSNAYLYLSSSQVEGMPLTLLEAMSYGLPCLVSNIAPHKEIIQESYNYGFLYEVESQKDLHSNLQHILSMNPDCLENVGKRAQSLIKKKFNWHFAAKKLNESYQVTSV